jgi:group I intron endonuclease
MTVGIYVIRCKTTNKAYIGSSKNIRLRWNAHRYKLRKGIHHSKKLQHAWNKYGEESFEFIVAEEVIDGLLSVFEQIYINKFNACKDGYNILTHAGTTIGANKIYEEQKVNVNSSLTPTARDNYDEAAKHLNISRSELIERLGRKGVVWLVEAVRDER